MPIIRSQKAKTEDGGPKTEDRQKGTQIKPSILTCLSVIPTGVEESLTIFSSL